MYRVLIVDDHASVRQGVRQVLSEQLAPTTSGEAENADKALEMVEQEEWDVVILDVNMPGKSSLDALKTMRRTHPGLPVLMFSVNPPEQMAARFIAAGATGYVSKGSPAGELVSAVRAAADARRRSGGASDDAADPHTTPDDALTAWRL